jgi:cytochrome o ubiquinol oxidase subunit IV
MHKPVTQNSYTIGFILSIMWTLLAYGVVVGKGFGTNVTVGIVCILAVAQLITQLVFFLHLGFNRSSRWNLITFSFMLMVLVIIVFGSLWIMQNLNYNMQMTPEQMNSYMKEQSNKGF